MSQENVLFTNALKRASRANSPTGALLSLHRDSIRYAEAARRARGFPLARSLRSAVAKIITVEATDYTVSRKRRLG